MKELAEIYENSEVFYSSTGLREALFLFLFPILHPPLHLNPALAPAPFSFSSLKKIMNLVQVQEEEQEKEKECNDEVYVSGATCARTLIHQEVAYLGILFFALRVSISARWD